jgi:integrase/recombinase XerD
LSLAVVRDLREARTPAGPEELAAFETDVLAGFVLARAAAGCADTTIRSDVANLEHVRGWFGRPLWEMQPADADSYFGTALHGAPKGTTMSRARALTVFFGFLELRHKVEIHQLTGHMVACPLDEINRPRGGGSAAIRIPPSRAQMDALFAGWRQDLASCRKFAPAARNYTAARLMAEVAPRVNEVVHMDLADVKWELGRFGKIHIRMGKGARGSGPRERMAPLINNMRPTLEWYVSEVRGQFGDDHTRPGTPLWPSERTRSDGSRTRAGAEVLRSAVAEASVRHVPDWPDKITPHVLRHFCASELYLAGMDLVAIQELLGHAWVATTMAYVHVHTTRVEDAWIAGQQRAADRLKGLATP